MRKCKWKDGWKSKRKSGRKVRKRAGLKDGLLWIRVIHRECARNQSESSREYVEEEGREREENEK